MPNRYLKVCPKCHKHYRLGVSGVGDGCDKCLGIKRDSNNYAWKPEQTEKVFAPFDTANDESTWFTVKREDAFSSPASHQLEDGILEIRRLTK